MNHTFQVSGHIVDPLNRKIYDGTLIVSDGRITSILPAERIGDDAPYILPGFIDSHVHIESSMLLPENFAHIAVRHGTIAAIADPHEIANVLGIEGINFMIDNGRRVPFHFFFGAPSCVPCTNMESSGAVIGADDIATLMQRDDIYFLGEMMNVPGVLLGDKEVLGKLDAARKARKPIDGHAPGLMDEGLLQYAAEGISTDHECSTLADEQARLDVGMKVLIREGSAAQNFDSLSPLLAYYSDELMFCTDDMHPDDLMKGHINQMVRRAIAKGYPLWNVLRAACVTPVLHYHIPCGLLQLGDPADFILVDNLSDFNILSTCISGNVFNRYTELPVSRSWTQDNWPNNFHAEPITAEDLRVILETNIIHTIMAFNGSLFTGQKDVEAKVVDGHVVSDIESDILKIVVLSRYAPAKPAIGFIKGFGLKRGALASTIAHDSHNIVAIGTSDEDIAAAINRVIQLKGGIVVEDNGEFDALPLPIAGLLSPLSHEETAAAYARLTARARALGCAFDAPFMTLSFMALPVIPKLKMTDKGLFDTALFRHVSPFVTK
ncbi:MAG: adenine deaminase [Bacteroidaceae bacterium]|nr:adenine deaminase [Bacteroidaceae bacterium]